MIKDKNLVKAIKAYILEDEDKNEVIAELKRYKESFPSVVDYNYYEYGNILPYYSQIADFYRKNNLEPSDSNEVLLTHFVQHIRYAIDELLKE